MTTPSAGGATFAVTPKPVAWYRIEDGLRVYYETEAWPNMTPLYTVASSATRLLKIGEIIEIPDGFDVQPNTRFCEWDVALKARLPAGTPVYVMTPEDPPIAKVVPADRGGVQK
jgi:hypothetical protein